MNQASPARKLEEVLDLAELCIEVLQQNEENHAEVMTRSQNIKFPQGLCHSGAALKRQHDWSLSVYLVLEM